MSLLERFALARRLIGCAHPITILVTYPTAAPSLEALRARTLELQTLWPHLFARVEGTNTNAPRWVGGERPWTGEELVFDQPLPTSGGILERQDILRQNSSFFQTLATKEVVEPLLRFTLTTSTTGGPSYLTFSIDHLLADGKGALRILAALTATSIADLKGEDLPPKLEDTVDIRPSYGTTASLAWSKLIQPKLPTFLQAAAPEVLNWPGPIASPIELPEGLSLLEIKPAHLDKLRSVCKSRKTTLQPVLMTAWAWSLVAVLETTRTDLPEFSLRADSPRDERKADLGHGYTTGNYYTGFNHVFAQPSKSDTRNFWETARQVAQRISDPAEIKRGQQVIGTMAYIPNGVNEPGSATAWEDYWLGEARKAEPYGSAFEMSNLGFTSLPEGAEAMDWMQAEDAFGAAMCANVIGHRNGLSLSTTWREGSAIALTQVKEVELVFESLIERLGAGLEGYERLVRSSR